MMSLVRPVIVRKPSSSKRTDVAGVEPPVVVDGLPGLLGHLVVAGEHARPADEDLGAGVGGLVVGVAVAVAALGEPDLGVRGRRSLRAEAERVRAVDGAGRGGLGEAVALEHQDAAGVEELEQLRGDRGGADQREAHPAAEDLPDAVEEDTVGQFVADTRHDADAAAASFGPADLAAGPHGAVHQLPADGSGLLVGLVVDLLEDARDGGEVGRCQVGQVVEHRLHVPAPEPERGAGVDGEELDEPREHVGEREERVEERVVAEVDDLLEVVQRPPPRSDG